jgi:hypothetical protein
VRSCFEEFIETNLMVRSEFNLVFWFVSYNIFYTEKSWTRSSRHTLSGVHARRNSSGIGVHACGIGRPLPPLHITDGRLSRIRYRTTLQLFFTSYAPPGLVYRTQCSRSYTGGEIYQSLTGNNCYTGGQIISSLIGRESVSLFIFL